MKTKKFKNMQIFYFILKFSSGNQKIMKKIIMIEVYKIIMIIYLIVMIVHTLKILPLLYFPHYRPFMKLTLEVWLK